MACSCSVEIWDGVWDEIRVALAEALPICWLQRVATVLARPAHSCATDAAYATAPLPHLPLVSIRGLALSPEPVRRGVRVSAETTRYSVDLRYERHPLRELARAEGVRGSVQLCGCQLVVPKSHEHNLALP